MDEIMKSIIEDLDDDYKSKQENVLLAILDCSKKTVCNRRYPFGYNEDQEEQAVKRYSGVIYQIAIYLWDKRGAEGQTMHSENGTNRSYESGGIPESMLSEVVPMVGCL